MNLLPENLLPANALPIRRTQLPFSDILPPTGSNFSFCSSRAYLSCHSQRLFFASGVIQYASKCTNALFIRWLLSSVRNPVHVSRPSVTSVAIFELLPFAISIALNVAFCFGVDGGSAMNCRRTFSSLIDSVRLSLWRPINQLVQCLP